MRVGSTPYPGSSLPAQDAASRTSSSRMHRWKDMLFFTGSTLYGRLSISGFSRPPILTSSNGPVQHTIMIHTGRRHHLASSRAPPRNYLMTTPGWSEDTELLPPILPCLALFHHGGKLAEAYQDEEMRGIVHRLCQSRTDPPLLFTADGAGTVG